MDTSGQVSELVAAKNKSASAAQRQRRSIAEKRRMVEETLVEGASVARIARAHGVNANQVFGWRRLYLAGRLGAEAVAICRKTENIDTESARPRGHPIPSFSSTVLKVRVVTKRGTHLFISSHAIRMKSPA